MTQTDECCRLRSKRSFGKFRTWRTRCRSGRRRCVVVAAALKQQRVLTEDFGRDWRSRFESFGEQPFASASIGQVHHASLGKGKSVVVKVQFPGVARSIDSDLDNLALLLSASMALPRGLFLDNTIRVMRQELRAECDYRQEARHGVRFRKLLADELDYRIPVVYEDLSTERVLTAERLDGRSLHAMAASDQDTRNRVREAQLTV